MVIVERYCSPTGGGLQDGTSEANAWTWVQAVANAIAGQRVNVKGIHTLAADSTIATSATTSAPLIWRGYGTTIGDGVEATLAFADGFQLTTTGSRIVIDKIGATGNIGSLILLGGQLNVLMRGTITNANSNGDGVAILAGGSFSKVIGCSIKCQNIANAFKAGINMLTNGSAFYNTIHTTGDGILFQNTFRNYRANHNLIVGNGGSTGTAIFISGADGSNLMEISGNTVFNFTDAVRMTQSPNFTDAASWEFLNNIFYSCTNGFLNDSGIIQEIGMTIANNAMGAVANKYTNMGDIPILDDDIDLTTDPFTNAAGLDFSLNDVAGGGILVKGKGIGAPAVTP